MYLVSTFSHFFQVLQIFLDQHDHGSGMSLCPVRNCKMFRTRYMANPMNGFFLRVFEHFLEQLCRRLYAAVGHRELNRSRRPRRGDFDRPPSSRRRFLLIHDENRIRNFLVSVAIRVRGD